MPVVSIMPCLRKHMNYSTDLPASLYQPLEPGTSSGSFTISANNGNFVEWLEKLLVGDKLELILPVAPGIQVLGYDYSTSENLWVCDANGYQEGWRGYLGKLIPRVGIYDEYAPVIKTTMVAEKVNIGICRKKYSPSTPDMVIRVRYSVSRPDIFNEWIALGYPMDKDFSYYRPEESVYSKQYYREKAKDIVNHMGDSLIKLHGVIDLKKITEPELLDLLLDTIADYLRQQDQKGK